MTTLTLHDGSIEGHQSGLQLPLIGRVHPSELWDRGQDRSVLPSLRRAMDVVASKLEHADLLYFEDHHGLSIHQMARVLAAAKLGADDAARLTNRTKRIGWYATPGAHVYARNLIRVDQGRWRKHVPASLVNAATILRDLIDVAMPSLYVNVNVAQYTTLSEADAWLVCAHHTMEAATSLGLPVCPFVCDGMAPDRERPVSQETAEVVAAFFREHYPEAEPVIWGKPSAGSPLCRALLGRGKP